MRLKSHALVLCTLLAMAAGSAFAQQANCPYPWLAGSAPASCAAPAKSGVATAQPRPSGYTLDSNWSVSAGAGSQGLPGASSTPLSQFARQGLDRNVAGAQVTGSYWFGRSQFSTRFALLQGEEKLGGFGLGAGYAPDFRNTWSQAAATARYGYWFDGFMPYASVTLASDIARSGYPGMPGAGREAWIPRVGVDFFAKRNFSGGIAYSAEQGSVVRNQVWSANLDFRF